MSRLNLQIFQVFRCHVSKYSSFGLKILWLMTFRYWAWENMKIHFRFINDALYYVRNAILVASHVLLDAIISQG